MSSRAYARELADPQKLLTYLLQPRVLGLPPDTIAVYLQATTKVFGVWASELAERWDGDDLPKVKNIVESTIERLGDFVSNPNIEVQERVRSCCLSRSTLRGSQRYFCWF